MGIFTLHFYWKRDKTKGINRVYPGQKCPERDRFYDLASKGNIGMKTTTQVNSDSYTIPMGTSVGIECAIYKCTKTERE
jgi:3-deoxy-D-manno-octulosonate 8-phosphate phosphatase KdsC-like HAD superfamily phosphatase